MVAAQANIQNAPIAPQLGQHVAPQPDPWVMRRFRHTPLRCEGPCKTAMCKLVQWFRDADVIYIMVRLTQQSLRSSDTSLRLMSKWIENDQKGMAAIPLPLYPMPLSFLPPDRDPVLSLSAPYRR